MLKGRFLPYIVGSCVVVLLGVAYLSYVNYKADQNHQEWVAEMTAFQRSIEGRHDHSSPPHSHHGEEESIAARNETTKHEGDNPAFVGMTPDGEYSYDIAGRLYISEEPMSQKEIDVNKYLLTGEMTPLVSLAIRETQESHEMLFEGKVVQTVLGPDGQRHQVLVPSWEQYEEGDTILESEINNPFLEMLEGAANSETRTPRRKIITEAGEVHPLPAEYYAIEDPYEQEEYFKKFDQSIQLGTSIAGIEKMIAAGNLDLSLTETEKEMVDQELAILERRRPFSRGVVPLSDKPPVKVRVISEEDVQQGDVRSSHSSDNPQALSRAYSETDTVSGETLPVDTEGILSPSDLPDMGKPISPPNVADIEKQLTPEGIEAELSEGLSTSPVDKAQQLIDEYGTAEGLRRLKEMDPEAARQFEQRHRPVPSRDVPDGVQSESGSKN